MAIEFKNIVPTILCGVIFEDSPKFLDMRAHVKEFIAKNLTDLCKKENDKCEIDVAFREGDLIAHITKKEKELLMVMDETTINIQEKKASDFYFFESYVPSILNSILTYIERKELSVLGMMFKVDSLLVSKDVDIISQFKNRFFALKEQDFTSLDCKNENLNRIGFELKFRRKDLLNTFIITTDSKTKHNNMIVKLDTRYDSKITGNKITINNEKTFSDFFTQEALAYFMNNIINGVVSDMLNASLALKG